MSQMPPGQGPTQMNYMPAPTKPVGLAVTSMVLGIVSLVLFCFWWLAIPCGILAIIFGAVALGKVKRGEAGGKGMAVAGLVTGTVAIAVAILIGILALVGISILGTELQKELQRQQQQQQGTSMIYDLIRYA